MKTIKIKDLELSLNDEQIKELQAQLAEPVNKRWKPEIGERYFILDSSGTGNHIWDNDSVDNYHLSIGNVFKTKEEAEQAIKTGWVAKLQAEQRIKDYILEKGYDTNVDWNYRNQEKYVICYDYEKKELIISSWHFSKESTLPYFVNKSEAEDTMKHCESDYKLLFGVE